jgi:hypothetical protein
MSPEFQSNFTLKTMIFEVSHNFPTTPIFPRYCGSATLALDQSLRGIGMCVNELFKDAPLSATLPAIPTCYLASQSLTLHHHLVQRGEKRKKDHFTANFVGCHRVCSTAAHLRPYPTFQAKGARTPITCEHISKSPL